MCSSDLEDVVIKTYEIPVSGAMGKKPDESVLRTFDFMATTEMASIQIENNGIDKLIRFDNFCVSKKQTTGIEELNAMGQRDLIHIQDNVLVLGEGIVSTQIYAVSGRKACGRIVGPQNIQLDKFPSGVWIVESLLENGQTLVKKVIN